MKGLRGILVLRGILATRGNRPEPHGVLEFVNQCTEAMLALMCHVYFSL